jgi:alpha-beta hydrolase superfamily lysophospholipase
MRRARAVGAGLLGLALCLSAACAPTIQRALPVTADFAGPRFEADRFVSFDGARLGLKTWAPPPERGEPWAVVVGLHGMNDHAGTFSMAGPWWAARGVATYAYDARGFGRSPDRGVWAGRRLLTEDARTALKVARARHPRAILAIVGESMGAATILAAAGDAAGGGLDADRIVLVAPAVRGWSNLPLTYRTTLWLGARTFGDRAVRPPRFVTARIMPSDNIAMLRANAADPLMLFETRIDAIHGLVSLMDAAFKAAPAAPPSTLLLYGSRDQLVPRRSVERTVARLPAHVRSIEYPDGWHMLLRDLQAENVWRDVAAFLADPAAPPPSKAGPVVASSRR